MGDTPIVKGVVRQLLRFGWILIILGILGYVAFYWG